MRVRVSSVSAVSVRHTVGAEAARPERSGWCRRTAISLSGVAPSVIATARCPITWPRHGPRTAVSPGPTLRTTPASTRCGRPDLPTPRLRQGPQSASVPAQICMRGNAAVWCPDEVPSFGDGNGVCSTPLSRTGRAFATLGTHKHPVVTERTGLARQHVSIEPLVLDVPRLGDSHNGVALPGAQQREDDLPHVGAPIFGMANHGPDAYPGRPGTYVPQCTESGVSGVYIWSWSDARTAAAKYRGTARDSQFIQDAAQGVIG
jgi:hypothetical protein